VSAIARNRAGAAFHDRAVRILSEVNLSAEIARSVAGKTTRRIAIGTVYPAMIGVLPAFLSRIARKYPDIRNWSRRESPLHLGKSCEHDAGPASRGSEGFLWFAPTPKAVDNICNSLPLRGHRDRLLSGFST
jgi:hypothetical protein